ncbi:MAG TPA: hypothetical protein VNH22_13620 [Blastocatellia bacterium]|jgi:hypothetical protein|nr:hypothetical protein [Blastocatellia bacterium]
MFSKGIKSLAPYWMSILLSLSTSAALAGGFQLSIESPSSLDPEMKDAVLVVRTFGCQVPADANLEATAEGVVNGKRRSQPVQLTPTSTGVYTIRQQWPSEGTWALAISGTYRGMTSSALVRLGPNGGAKLEASEKEKWPVVRVVHRKLTAVEIETALKSSTASQPAGFQSSAAGPYLPHGSLVVAGLGAAFSVAGILGWRRRSRSGR